jgi:hypothetical protein
VTIYPNSRERAKAFCLAITANSMLSVSRIRSKLHNTRDLRRQPFGVWSGTWPSWPWWARYTRKLLTRIMHETLSRDRGDGRATGQPQGLGPEAYVSARRKVRDPRTPGRTAISAVAAGGSCILRVKGLPQAPEQSNEQLVEISGNGVAGVNPADRVSRMRCRRPSLCPHRRAGMV